MRRRILIQAAGLGVLITGSLIANAQDGCGKFNTIVTSIHQIAIAPNGDILIAGRGLGGAFDDIFVARLDSGFNIKWHYYIGRGQSDNAVSLVMTPDGGMLTVGSTTSIGAGSGDFYLVKLDSAGNIQWTRTIGGPNSDFGEYIAPTNDGGYIVTGYESSFGAGNYDVYLIKLDSAGNVQWSKAYGGTNRDYGYYVTQTSDGGFIIAGCTRSFGAGGFDGYLIKTDASGTLQWSTTVGGTDAECLYHVVEIPGGFLATGYTRSSGAGNDDIYLVRVDGSGNLIWTKTIGSPQIDRGHVLVPAHDGNYLLVGENTFALPTKSIYLAKIDINGNILWERAIGDSFYSYVPQTAVQLSSGNILIGGYHLEFGYSYPIIVVTDSVGRINDSSCTCLVVDTFAVITQSVDTSTNPITAENNASNIQTSLYTDSFYQEPYFGLSACGLCKITVRIDTSNKPQLNAIVSSLSNNYSCQWNTGDTLCSITASGPGTYWVTVSNDRGCVATDTITIGTPSEINDPEHVGQSICQIYTMPDGTPILTCSEEISELIIYTLDGRMVGHKQLPPKHSVAKLDRDVFLTCTSLYVIRVKTISYRTHNIMLHLIKDF